MERLDNSLRQMIRLYYTGTKMSALNGFKAKLFGSYSVGLNMDGLYEAG
ncbi:hypothetical protein P7H19_17605 [Paenibacillus larvae]|nr:hypothetical protein [Paenibacillus larvae]MDT2237730.1 hypothetical protein [Paenibacillus larvae]